MEVEPGSFSVCWNAQGATEGVVSGTQPPCALQLHPKECTSNRRVGERRYLLRGRPNYGAQPENIAP